MTLCTFMKTLHPYFQLKGKKGKGKAESVVDGAVADTEVFTEELHVSVCIICTSFYFLFELLSYILCSQNLVTCLPCLYPK